MQSMDLDSLSDEITTLCGHLDAAEYRLLELIRQFDERAALLVEPDPGFAINDVEVRVGPIDAARRAVNDLVPLEAFLEIEIFLPQHE